MPAGGFLFESFVKELIRYSRRGLLFGIFCKGLTKYSRRGLLGEIFDKLRIQCRMHIFEKMSQVPLNKVLTLPDYRTQKMLQIPLKSH